MKLLLIHADFLEFEAREKTEVAEDVSDEQKSGRAEETLVSFMAVEDEDEADPGSVIDNAYKAIEDVRDRVGAESVVIYPYAHLSRSLSSPGVAIQVMDGVCERFEERGVEFLRLPFGWYKSFNLSCKGHPLSELSRNITPEPMQEEEREIRSKWKVIDEEGIEHDVSSFEATPEFENIIKYEVEGSAEKGEEPPHISLMQDKELVGYDSLSDVGNLRWYPKGKLVRDLLIDYVNDMTNDYGAFRVETPIMYDLGDKAVSEHSSKFGERQYRFKSGNRRMVLRFAACFGMFSIMHDMFISSKDLPLKIYELSTYSFRREQRGELMGLRRQRTFTMPDMHTACNDMGGAREEFRSQVNWVLDTEEDFGLKYQVIFRATEDFYEANVDWIKSLAKDFGRPTLIEIIEKRKHYWVSKCDFAALDALGRPLENPTVQIDVESSERFDISYYEGEEEKRPPVLHTSPTGSIERVLCAILEGVAKEDKPQFPVWLSPTQVRLIPVGGEHLESCVKVAEKLSSASIRVDIDDRDRTVGKRVRRSEKDWVPYTVVYGDKEEGSKELPIRVRKKEDEISMDIEEFKNEVRSKIRDKPYKPLSLPLKLSDRPSFIG